MGFFKKLGKDVQELVGFNSEDEEIDEMDEEQFPKATQKKQRIEEEADEFRYEDYSTIFIDPKQFEDCKKIAAYIEKEKMITINLENIGPNVAQRIMDFLAGAMEIKNASFAQIAKNVYTIVPENMKIYYEGKKREKKLIDLEKGDIINGEN
ncbi:cell division protein SepF [Fusobacterium nucleatum]|uniref:cell division protein SepF n=1 Tax=Fusobacterium nucleatum TaxID=851 RepID=UPI003CFF9ECC